MRILTEEHRKYAIGRGWTEKDLKNIGAYSGSEGNLIGKICFPVTTYAKEEVGVIARDTKIKNYTFKFWTNFWSYFLWVGLDENEKTIILCEGPFDLGWLLGHGFHAGAYLGSSLNQAQARVISRFYENAIFVMDNDQAGLQGFKRSERMLEKLGVNVYSIRTIGCKDLSELCEQYPDKAGVFFTVLRERLSKIKAQSEINEAFRMNQGEED